MYNIVVGILQAVGDSRHPLYYLIFSSIVNIVLDLLFVGLLGFGVGAAALATIISQFSSAFLCMLRLMRTKDVYQVQISQIRFHRGMLGQIIGIGLPSDGSCGMGCLFENRRICIFADHLFCNVAHNVHRAESRSKTV